MLRNAILKKARSTRLSAQRRTQSSQTADGGRGGVALKVALGITTVAGVGTLAYAKVDRSFAKNLRNTAPFLEPVLDAIGADTSGQTGISNGIRSPPVETQQFLLKQSETTEPDKQAPKKALGDDHAKSATMHLQENEVQKQKENFIFEQTLRAVTSAAEKASSEAVSDVEIAVAKTSEYTTKLMSALEEATGTSSEDHYMWKDANEAKTSHISALKKSQEKYAEASKALTRLEELIGKGRSDPTTRDNINLSQADQTLLKMRKVLEESNATLAKSLEKANLAKRSENAIEEGKKRLIEEVNTLLPPGKTFPDPEQLSVEDLRLLVYHAHKKIEFLLQELSRVQLTLDEKAKQYLQQRNALDKEISRQKSEVAKLVSERVDQERESFERELQNQLRRQVGVHTEHLREALDDQRKEFTRTLQFSVEKAREEERSLHVARLSEAVELLQKMESYLSARKRLDEASKKAKSVWLSFASLKHVLAEGRTDNVDTPQPLAADIIPLREASESSEFVKLVLDTISEEALKRGVYPEVALKARFNKVETECRRVALMEGQNGGGPGRYLLSYLMSLFMIYPKPIPQEELDKEQKVNPLMWDTYDILSRVRASLQREDLEQALRYANQLKGTPRQVAKDWIRELRLLLETKQATNALLAYTATTIAEDFPKQ